MTYMTMRFPDLVLQQLGTLLTYLYMMRRRRRQGRSTRRFWVCPTNGRRAEHGAWEHFVQELLQEEPEKFKNYHRLTIDQFNSLLNKIGPVIQRQRVIRDPIPAGLKLSLTLRHLAGGENQVSLSYHYRIGRSTTSMIISKTCEAIWRVLQPEVLVPPTAEGWKQIADDFYTNWNFPNCVGAIDGKHVLVQAPANSGSDFFNYKGSFSTSLLACVDAHYRFTLVSIGSKGRESDGGIFQNSDFGQSIVRERFPLPQPRCFDRFPHPLPPVFIGDQAFALLPQLMRPYPSSNDAANIIFNYRHSRARRVVENAFGIMASRFRIMRRPINVKIETVDLIVQAIIVLHNYLRTEELKRASCQYVPHGFADWEDGDGTLHLGLWRQEPAPSGMTSLVNTHARNPSTIAKNNRDLFRQYYMCAGQVSWQWRQLPSFYRPNAPPVV